MSAGLLAPLSPGFRAPDFDLPAVNRPGSVTLGQYRGVSAVLLGLYRGLECPFCRQQIGRLGLVADRLASAGVEPVAVIQTRHDRAALYLRHRPTPVTLLADVDATTHRAYGLPRIELMLNGGPGVAPTLARGNQVVGHFLVDRDGIIRWSYVEHFSGPAGRPVLPSQQDLLDALALIGS
jgi:peroxiredoxin